MGRAAGAMRVWDRRVLWKGIGLEATRESKCPVDPEDVDSELDVLDELVDEDVGE